MARLDATRIVGRSLYMVICLTSLCIDITQTQSGCGGDESGTTGVIRSPGYPADVTSITNGQSSFRTCWPPRTYSYNDCVWRITSSDPQGNIELTVTDMKFTRNECCRNYIEVRDGLSSTADVLAGPCGTGSFPPILSSGNTMRVQLRSSSQTSGHRFQATWKTGCSRVFTAASGQLQSPGHPNSYPSNKDCTYLIEQPRGYRVQIDFTHFRLDDALSSGTCLDYLEIFDGPTDRFPRLGSTSQLCGIASPGRLTSSRSQVFFKFHSDSTTVSDRTGFRATYSSTTPECTDWTNLPASGQITSPGFPEPFPISATCRWEIPVPRGQAIDFTFHTIELGPDNDDILDCSDSRVKSVVSVYEVDQANRETLLARYCRRNGFSNMITTGLFQSKMIVVFETKNVGSSVTERPLINGFNATYTSRTIDEYNQDNKAKLLAYGPFTEDTRLTGLTSRPVPVEMNPPVQVGDMRYKYALIFQDGKLAFSTRSYEWIPTSQPRCNSRNYQNMCPYCANINCSSHADAAIYFRLHKKGITSAEEDIFPEVNDDVRRFKGTSDFNASSVLVVTWEKVQRKRRNGSLYPGNATFQVAVVVSEKETYGLVYYKHNAMNWTATEPNPLIDVGVTTTDEGGANCQDFVLSRTEEVLYMDKILGNIGKDGEWVYKLGEMIESGDQACNDWYNRNLRLKDFRKTPFERLPKCPCVKSYTNRMEAFGIWASTASRTGLTDNKSMKCYRLTRAASQRFYPFGKECCYKYDRYEPNNRIELLVEDRDAATATAYNPLFPETYRNYIQEDKMAYEACCIKSNSTTSCNQFFELRPKGTCEANPTFVYAWQCCDPFILTLDEGGYTFNGWGEYTMVTSRSPVAFTLQARTDLAETETGKLTNATVFTAFGAEENRVRVFVGLEPNNRSALVIYAKNEDFSRRFQNDPNFQVDTDDFFLLRNNDTLEVSFPSGVNLRVSIRIKSLTMALSLPKTFQNKTRGLLGNFNGNKTDDFILPDGSSLGPEPTERQIFETFGAAWATTTDNSVMRYGEREGPQNYSHPEFVPLFLDEQPEETRNRAKDKCGDNLACQYDFFATGSETFATDSMLFKDDADRANKAIKNSVPLVQVPSVLRVTDGQTHTFRINGSDLDGDSLTYYTEDITGRVVVNSFTGVVNFSPDFNTPVKMSFYAMDNSTRSPSQSVEVFICRGCSSHGRCAESANIETSDGEFASYLFHRVECICNAGWEGDMCDIDSDGCADNPCMAGQTCRDLTPQEQGNSGIGFDCGPCPPGFGRFPGDVECRDIDECQGSNDCQMTCTNTYGSFECGCRAGYRLHSDGRTCLDINECDEKTSSCQQICNNTVGGYECGCEAGYTLEVSGETCRQTEEFVRVCMYSACSQGCKPGVDPTTGEPALQCFCFAGYDNVTEDSAECRDHDECQDSDNPCSQRCVDFDGGFSCSCYDGYYLADDTVTCLPCSYGTYGPSCQYRCRCSGHGVGCDNVRGCICQNGWLGSQCQDDLDECTGNLDTCGAEEECLNTPGSFICRCPIGYERNSTTGDCKDVNECGPLSLLNTCGEQQICKNVPGSFYCACVEGYSFSNGQCRDVDECSLGISDCEHECTNLPGSYNCECRYGYRLNTDRATCSQVADVCAVEENLSCDHGCTLNDDNRAVCFCNVGFRLDGDNQTCSRVSTCNNFGCSHSCATVNTQPVCSCPPGNVLAPDMKTCQECPRGTFGVDCANNCSCGQGALRCNASIGCVCKDGWTGQRCERDVNECDVTAVSQLCDARGALCKNTFGSYICVCRDGFEMDGTGVCEDIDECRNGLCGQQCENSPGSYRCLCSQGFSLDDSTGSCKDIDECALSATNRCTQTCINLQGSYRCACNQTGFVLSADGVSCKPSAACNRTDCPTEHGGCSEENCFCDSGYQLSASNTCEAINVSWCSVPLCEQDCQEISNGSAPFLCSCRDGYILNDDKRTCREKEVPSGCTRTDCPTVNGGCSKEICFCNSGYRLAASNTCEPTASGACRRRDCPSENGGCRDEQCFCDSGYQLTDANTCQLQGLDKFHVILTIDIPLSIQPSELNNVDSTTYIAFSQEVSQQLKSKLGPPQDGITDVRVTDLRIGSLIVGADVFVDMTNFPNVMRSLASKLQLLRKDTFVVQGQSGNVTSMAVDGTELGLSWTSCEVLQTISPCSEDEQCDDSGDGPVCRLKVTPESTDSRLAIGLGVGLGLTALLIAIAVLCFKANKAKKSRSTSIVNDNPYALRSTLQSPQTPPVSSYSNEAYNADTSPEAWSENPYNSLSADRQQHTYEHLGRPNTASKIGLALTDDAASQHE